MKREWNRPPRCSCFFFSNGYNLWIIIFTFDHSQGKEETRVRENHDKFSVLLLLLFSRWGTRLRPTSRLHQTPDRVSSNPPKVSDCQGNVRSSEGSSHGTLPFSSTLRGLSRSRPRSHRTLKTRMISKSDHNRGYALTAIVAGLTIVTFPLFLWETWTILTKFKLQNLLG